MNAVYSSRSFGDDKRRAWEAVVSQIYAAMEVQVADAGKFEGVITQCSLDDLDLTRAVVDYEIASRKRRHIASDVSQSCVFIVRQKRSDDARAVRPRGFAQLQQLFAG
jgi:hypothetical protein